jgi:hypothetical protein
VLQLGVSLPNPSPLIPRYNYDCENWENTRRSWCWHLVARRSALAQWWNIEAHPLGRLPGDIWVQNEHFLFYFPLTTGILLSLGLSALLWLGRFVISR